MRQRERGVEAAFQVLGGRGRQTGERPEGRSCGQRVVVQGRACQASDPRKSGDGVRLSLLADAQPRACPTGRQREPYRTGWPGLGS